MTMDKEECTPYEFLLFEHLSPSEERSALDIQKIRLAWLALDTWQQGISVFKFIALNVPGCLGTMRVSCKLLATLFHNTPDIMSGALMPEHDRLIRLCLYMSPPFQTKESDCLRDMRPAYKNRVGHRCQDRVKLVEALVTALYEYEASVQAVRSAPQQQVAAIQESVNGLDSTAWMFLDRRLNECLPEALKGIHTQTAYNAFQLVRTIMQALGSAEDASRRVWQQKYGSDAYTKLLSEMKTALKNYGPAEHYSNEAIYAVLSAILSALLIVPQMLLDSDCTTPSAIQRRLSRSQSVR